MSLNKVVLMGICSLFYYRVAMSVVDNEFEKPLKMSLVLKYPWKIYQSLEKTLEFLVKALKNPWKFNWRIVCMYNTWIYEQFTNLLIKKTVSCHITIALEFFWKGLEKPLKSTWILCQNFCMNHVIGLTVYHHFSFVLESFKFYF